MSRVNGKISKMINAPVNGKKCVIIKAPVNGKVSEIIYDAAVHIIK